ncbi:hypothetical protein L6452_41312 [Arctium lappa]|uniref:Uncharacterized protein n=1 Tax=Arctium lappa TaxID=4217 RepID=A0ACB8XPN5_ARCLA|nr:hypothetical protein L6452_41312 [Arctium lappa]
MASMAMNLDLVRPRKKRRNWDSNLHMKFMSVVETLGGLRGFRLLENQLSGEKYERICEFSSWKSCKFRWFLFLEVPAIARFKELKRVCEVHAISKILMPYKRTVDNDARPQNILVGYSEKKDGFSSAKPWTTITYFNNKEVINLESDDEEVNNISAPSIHGSASVTSAPAIQSGPIGFDPREKHVGNSFGTPSVMIGQEPPAKRRRIWPVELYRRFLHVVNTLGGPAVATPKEIKDRMQVADITEDEIINHLMNYRLENSCRACGASPLLQFHDTRSMVGQDVLKMSGNGIQAGSQQMPLRIGEPSNGQMAAAGNNTNGGWKLICSVRGTCSAPTQDMLKMRGMPVQSGFPQMPLYAGESSNRQMEAAPNEANGGQRLISAPYIHANGRMNTHM